MKWSDVGQSKKHNQICFRVREIGSVRRQQQRDPEIVDFGIVS